MEHFNMILLRAKILSYCCIIGFSASSALAVNIDFSVEDDGITPLANGQKIDAGQEFGALFDVSSAGNNAGAAIFDSTPGTNPADPDLWVNLGNILILQENNGSADAITGDFFNTPNDDASQGNQIFFDFFAPISAQSIDLIDVNGNGPVIVTLFDQGGLTRTYVAPMHWTFDVSASGPKGFETLDLTTLANQPGEGGGIATASEQAGFNPNDVINITVTFQGSGGLDNLEFVPEPATGLLIGLAGFVMLRRRR
jgi:hypothetical protein